MSLLARLHERSRARTRNCLLPSGILLSEQLALRQKGEIRQFLTLSRWTPKTFVRFEKLRQALRTQANLLIVEDQLLQQNQILPLFPVQREKLLQLYPLLIDAFYKQPVNAGTTSDTEDDETPVSGNSGTDSKDDAETISATEQDVSETEKDESYDYSYDDYSDEGDVEMTMAVI